MMSPKMLPSICGSTSAGSRLAAKFAKPPTLNRAATGIRIYTKTINI